MGNAALQHELVDQLRDCLAERRIRLGMKTLEDNCKVFASVHPNHPGTAVLLGQLAQWIDVGFSAPVDIEEILNRFPPESRVHLPLIEYVHLRLTEGFLAMCREENECAIRHFTFIASVQDEVGDQALVAVANFWTGRCLRKSGHYDGALDYTVKARDLALGLGFSKMAAIMQIAESWLLFQKGRSNDALRILQNAEEALRDTDDYVARGNIESSYGRIARRQGRNDRALAHFNFAISYFRRQDPEHPNVARSLLNLVVVKRLIGVQMQRKLDRETISRKSGGHDASRTSTFTQDRAALEALRDHAWADLNHAEAIYSRIDNHRGRGSVHLMRGFLNLDNGQLDAAFDEAVEAYCLAEEKSDNILMARARILQCIIESNRYEEGIEEHDDPGVHAQRAADCARDAVELAHKTENRRLLARAYVWQGLVWANRLFDNMEGARKCCDEATNLLRPEGQDYIWDDLQQLRTRILGKTRVDTVLREWSQGLVGDKSFQQITEDFAAIVIPRVWERESRKVSRVAAKLSVSPKKVRRVLQAAGVLDKKPI
jgi:tetratricopeptide (TPR) repeat protein